MSAAANIQTAIDMLTAAMAAFTDPDLIEWTSPTGQTFKRRPLEDMVADLEALERAKSRCESLSAGKRRNFARMKP